MEYLLQSAQNRIIVLFIAAAVDLLIGDPHWLWHPVQGIGALISFFEKMLRGLFSIPPQKTEGAEERPGSFRIRERIAGGLMVVFVLAASTGIIMILLALCQRIHPVFRLLFEGVLCGRLLALRSLGEAGISVRDPLLKGDIEGARRAVSMIVGRDTDRLDEEGIAKAAVETVAENTSDGVTAPLFYMILLGGAGGIFYKAVNTMDSMTGYKNARYRYFGTAAARLDDLMNFIPARLTALFMILACYLPGKESVSITETSTADAQRPEFCQDQESDNIEKNVSGENPSAGNQNKTVSGENPSSGNQNKTVSGENPSAGNQNKAGFSNRQTAAVKTVRIPDGAAAFRIWRRDRLKSPSPNSAQTESVCAGALHLRLLGDTWYFGEIHHKMEIGDGGRKVEPEDITRSVRLMNRCAFLMFAAGIAVLAMFLI